MVGRSGFRNHGAKSCIAMTGGTTMRLSGSCVAAPNVDVEAAEAADAAVVVVVVLCCMDDM